MPETLISIIDGDCSFSKRKKNFFSLWALVSIISNMKWNKLTVSKYNLVCMHDNTKPNVPLFLAVSTLFAPGLFRQQI